MLDRITWIKKVGNLDESKLYDGIVLETLPATKNCPRLLNDAKICLLNVDFEGKLKNEWSKVEYRIEDSKALDLHSIQIQKKMLETVLSWKPAVLITCKTIPRFLIPLVHRAGVVLLCNIQLETLDRLSKAISAPILTFIQENVSSEGLEYLLFSDFKKSLQKEQQSLLGVSSQIEFYQELGLVRIAKNITSQYSCCTFVLQAPTMNIVDEVKRALGNALAALLRIKQGSPVVCGGGAIEIALARFLKQKANGMNEKRKFVIEGFSRALIRLASILISNGGWNALEIVQQVQDKQELELKKGSWKESALWGVDLSEGFVKNMTQLGVVDPLDVKESAITFAVETCSTLLRIDQILVCNETSLSKFNRVRNFK